MSALENSFRAWSDESSRADVRLSRKRILLIFLLIRYTGARLNEVLSLGLPDDIDPQARTVRLGASNSSSMRLAPISEDLENQINMLVSEISAGGTGSETLKIDEGHVRRKFYERALSCGFAKSLGSPQAIRRARAVELMKNNVPLPVVQRILGHSTPNLTASLVAFSEEEIRQVTAHFIEKEGSRKSSARNTFYGRITRMETGDVQSLVELATLAGDKVYSVITNNSLSRLGIKLGSWVTAEVKAPWVVIHKDSVKEVCAAENIFRGQISKILLGKIVCEVSVRIHDGTEICSLITLESLENCGFRESDEIWASFNAFSVIIHVD